MFSSPRHGPSLVSSVEAHCHRATTRAHDAARGSGWRADDSRRHQGEGCAAREQRDTPVGVVQGDREVRVSAQCDEVTVVAFAQRSGLATRARGARYQEYRRAREGAGDGPATSIGGTIVSPHGLAHMFVRVQRRVMFTYSLTGRSPECVRRGAQSSSRPSRVQRRSPAASRRR